MIKIIYAILAIAIKDLELWLSNLNQFIQKSVIWFEPLAQKSKIGKQIIGAL